MDVLDLYVGPPDDVVDRRGTASRAVGPEAETCYPSSRCYRGDDEGDHREGHSLPDQRRQEGEGHGEHGVQGEEPES